MMDHEGSKCQGVIKVLVETGQEGPRERSLTCILDASEGLNCYGNLKLKRFYCWHQIAVNITLQYNVSNGNQQFHKKT